MRFVNTTITGLLLAIIIALQFVKLPIPVLGVIINSFFIFGALYTTDKHAYVLAILTPIAAFTTGTLAAPLLPLVPVILLGNVAYIYIFARCKNSSYIMRLLFPSLLKGFFISFIGYSLLSHLNLTATLEWLIIPVLGVQFLTSALGIVLAEVLHRHIPKLHTNQ
ncbi:MAG: hypothetical protein PHF29_09060 [Candidatus Riflebacteria bacterium]|nr:hypothetical protein [Candidatus Riflebacteria bacterium]